MDSIGVLKSDLSPSSVILSPSPVILSEAKNLFHFRLRVNCAKDLRILRNRARKIGLARRAPECGASVPL